jgi:hypothetical protein
MNKLIKGIVIVGVLVISGSAFAAREMTLEPYFPNYEHSVEIVSADNIFTGSEILLPPKSIKPIVIDNDFYHKWGIMAPTPCHLALYKDGNKDHPPLATVTINVDEYGYPISMSAISNVPELTVEQNANGLMLKDLDTGNETGIKAKK